VGTHECVVAVSVAVPRQCQKSQLWRCNDTQLR